MKRVSEPSVTVGSITAAVTAVLALLVAFGIPMTEAQQTAILGVAAVVAPLIVGAVARGFVTPAGKVAARRESDGTVIAGEAAEQTPGTTVSVHTIG